jgi:hypothetical protein
MIAGVIYTLSGSLALGYFFLQQQIYIHMMMAIIGTRHITKRIANILGLNRISEIKKTYSMVCCASLDPPIELTVKPNAIIPTDNSCKVLWNSLKKGRSCSKVVLIIF